MAWLRIDDGFPQHPKVVKLARADRWTWLEVLCYCARYKTKGVVLAMIGEVVRGATPAYLNRCFELHLLDMAEDGENYVVHDWDDYNGRDPKILQAERQRKRRDIAVTNGVTDSEDDRDENVTRARARGRVPVPSTEVANATSGKRAPDELWEALVIELGEVGTTTERGERNRAIKELREAGATASDIHLRCRVYRRKWPEMELTPSALKKHWSSLAAKPAREPQPVEVALDLPNISDEEREQNVERIRSLTSSIGKDAA